MELSSLDYEENGYKYYSYVWQTPEGIRKKGMNTYEGVYANDIELVETLIKVMSNKVGQIMPVNFVLFKSDFSNIELVLNDWRLLKNNPNDTFPEGDFVAAAGVEINNMHNVGSYELFQLTYIDPKIIGHEMFHLFQNPINIISKK